MEQHTATLWIKIYAILDYIGAFFLLIAGLGLIFGGTFLAGMLGVMSGGMLPEEQLATGIGAGALAVLGILCLALAFVYFAIGRAVWQHKSWARTAQIVLSVLSVFSFPLGTLIGAFGIYLFGFEPTTKAMFGAGTPVVVAKVAQKPAAKKKK